jgi:oligopeptide/dipeptide ABC transporter ATP-binding protein
MITHRVPLAQAGQGFELARARLVVEGEMANDRMTLHAETASHAEGLPAALAGSVRDIIANPQHPYTRGLLAANLHGAVKGERLQAIPGAPPALETAPNNCSFAPRCLVKQESCEIALPPNVSLSPQRAVRCVHAAPVAAQTSPA